MIRFPAEFVPWDLVFGFSVGKTSGNHTSRRDLKMKSHTVYLTFNLPARMEFQNITPDIQQIVRDSGVQEGMVLVNAMHITASVFINDDESGLHQD